MAKKKGKTVFENFQAGARKMCWGGRVTHRGVMYMRANQFEVFASYTLGRRGRKLKPVLALYRPDRGVLLSIWVNSRQGSSCWL